ncbi:unnamed protein product [Phytomonas sp. EM1]|nr:unnamed protein product [Phytomonas sp. EM1]|eukprot:CCW64511.1 unnamed protein product [Phytomonas sp. isolate EM1]
MQPGVSVRLHLVSYARVEVHEMNSFCCLEFCSRFFKQQGYNISRSSLPHRLGLHILANSARGYSVIF